MKGNLSYSIILKIQYYNIFGFIMIFTWATHNK